MPFRHFIYRFVALFMALLIFTTSVGAAVDVHYCQGQMKSFSFFGKAKSCYELLDASVKKSCNQQVVKVDERTKQCSISKKKCCENKTHYFQLDSDSEQEIQAQFINPQILQFVVAYIAAFFLDDTISIDRIPFLDYQAPLLTRDIPVLIQSFLL